MRLVRFALPALFLAALALFGSRAWTEAEDRAARALALEHARTRFLARAALSRGAPDEARYHADLRQDLRAWFAEQAELGNRWPALRSAPRPFTPPPPQARDGTLREFEELAASVVGGWREGRLELFQTAAQGGLRLDLLRVTRRAAPQPHLEVDVAVWGVPEEPEAPEAADGRPQPRAGVPLGLRGLFFRFFDAGGRLIAAMPGEGEPSLRLDLPARLVADAPPGVVLARYQPALFPAEAAEVEWTLAVQVRAASGEARPARAIWRTRADPSWALKAGERWGGQERTAAGDALPTKAEAPAADRKAAARRTSGWPVRADASE